MFEQLAFRKVREKKLYSDQCDCLKSTTMAMDPLMTSILAQFLQENVFPFGVLEMLPKSKVVLLFKGITMKILKNRTERNF